MVLACIHICLFCREKWIQHKMPVNSGTSILELNQEKVTAVAHNVPQVRAVGDHLPHHEPQVCAVEVTACFLICRKKSWKSSTNARRTHCESFSRSRILENDRYWSFFLDKTAQQSSRKMCRTGWQGFWQGLLEGPGC